jgi:hypothetical protein
MTNNLRRCHAGPTTCVYYYSFVNWAEEEEGFEPPELAFGGFQDRCLKPLGHSSTSRLAGTIRIRMCL